MSTAATVRAAWLAKVWADSTITAYTPKIYAFDIEELSDISAKHEAMCFYEQKINFIQYKVARASAFSVSMSAAGDKQAVQQFPVTVRYYKDAKEDFDGSAYNAVEDFFAALITSVEGKLGYSWSGTVDYYVPQAAPASITLGYVGGRACWIGQYSFTGFMQASF